MLDGYKNGYCKYYYENGKLKSEGNYKMGKEEGLIISYFENGHKESEEFFLDGILNGKCKYFDENEKLIIEGSFLENERDGIWNFYSPKTSNLSSQITIVKYDKGQALSTKISTY